MNMNIASVPLLAVISVTCRDVIRDKIDNHSATPRKNVALVQKSRKTSVEWSFFAGCPRATFLRVSRGVSQSKAKHDSVQVLAHKKHRDDRRIRRQRSPSSTMIAAGIKNAHAFLTTSKRAASASASHVNKSSRKRRSVLIVTAVLAILIMASLTKESSMAVRPLSIATFDSVKNSAKRSLNKIALEEYVGIHDEDDSAVEDAFIGHNHSSARRRTKQLYEEHPEWIDGPFPLDKWIVEYFAWHNEIRSRFPGASLVSAGPSAAAATTANNTSADSLRLPPKLFIRYCIRKCGGLFDRLSNILGFLVFAHQTQRVLLLQHLSPTHLHNFLEPSVIDWSPPIEAGLFYKPRKLKSFGTDYLKPWGANRNNYSDGLDMWKHHPDLKKTSAVRILYVSSSSWNATMYIERDYGAEVASRLDENYGAVWKALFRPVPPIQARIDETMSSFRLVPGQYSVVHCRVRHAGRFENRPDVNGRQIDMKGLDFRGDFGREAMRVATHAMACQRNFTTDVFPSKMEQGNDPEPVYFMSDSEDLVEYMVKNYAIASSATRQRIVARNTTKDGRTAHLDSKGLPPEAYYATFIDLYIAMQARCILYGIGNYAFLAAKISRAPCLMQHEDIRPKQYFNLQKGWSHMCMI